MNSIMRHLASVLLIFLSALVQAQPRLDAARIDALVESARLQAKFPGVAVAIITRDGTFTKGYGVRNLQSNQPVTSKTLFALGSITKSFTALGAALLVDEGKLSWDKPVREYLPWFRMHDPSATELMSVKDLLTHRSGLPRYDFLRFAVPLSREELVRRLRYLPPTAGFRERYQYQNLMYTAAGYLTGVVNDSSWEDLIEKRIFAQLGMAGSTVRVTDTRKRDDYASPHETGDGVLKPVEFYDYQHFGVGPNGAVNSSAQDMIRYLKFHMGDGAVNGKRILSKRQMDELHRPQMVMSETASYALGWQVDWSPGFKLVSHGGSITGFNAFAAFSPEKQEAIIVMVNSDGSATRLANALMKEVLNWKLPVPGSPPAQSNAQPPATVDGPPTHALSAYVGRYIHPAFGPCEISESEGKLKMSFPALSATLRHERYDVFRAQRYGVQFLMDHRGLINSFRMQVEPTAPPLVFQRDKTPAETERE